MRDEDDDGELARTRRTIRDRARLRASLSRAPRDLVDDGNTKGTHAVAVDANAPRAAGAFVEASMHARARERGEEETTMLEIQRAVFEALSAMRETQQRMNGKLSWISRSLPKIYDAVANDVTTAIDDQGDRIEALNERLVKLSASSTATMTSNDGATTPAGGGERREESKPESKALTRLGYDEIEQDGEDHAADLPKLGRVGDPADEKAGGANLSTAHGRNFERKNSLRKSSEDPRKWTRKMWLKRLREQTPKIFGALEDVVISEMLDGSKCYFVRRGARVVRQGERGSSMFIIVLGKVHVVVTDPLKNRGEPLQVATLLPGDFFGEIALITGDVRRATVMAPYEGDGNVWVLEFSKQDLGSVLLARPNVMRALTEVCADRKLDQIA